MDIEKTMEFILENLADVAVKQARSERQIHGLQTIAKTGMRMLAKTHEEVRSLAASQSASQKRTDQAIKELTASQKQTDQAIKELAAAQKRTDERFQRWLDRGTNGKAR